LLKLISADESSEVITMESSIANLTVIPTKTTMLYDIEEKLQFYSQLNK